MWRSDPHTAVARTRMRTSPLPGRGTGTDLTCVPSRPGSGFVLTTAVIRAGNRESVIGNRDLGRADAFFVFLITISDFRPSISGLVVAHVPGPRTGRSGRELRGCDGVDVAGDEITRPRHRELLEQEREFRFERVADRLPRSGREIPDLLLERSDRLLAGLVEELALRLPLLLLVCHPLEEPALDGALQRQGERRMVVPQVLEMGGEVDLGAVVLRKAAEELGGQRGRPVLDGAGELILLPRDFRDARERVEVDANPLNGAVRSDDAAVRADGLDRHLGDPLSVVERPAVFVHVGAEHFRRGVGLADLADLPSHGNRHLPGLPGADELREARGERGVDGLLLLERRLREVDERRRIDVDLEEPGRDGFVDQRLDRGDLLVRLRLHLLRVGLEVVALEEDRTLPFLADRRRENDDGVFARPLLGVTDLAA